MTASEKATLININSFFWNKELNDGKVSLKRIDEATVIDSYDDRHITEAISSIRVPDEIFDEAKRMFGDKVLRC